MRKGYKKMNIIIKKVYIVYYNNNYLFIYLFDDLYL